MFQIRRKLGDLDIETVLIESGVPLLVADVISLCRQFDIPLGEFDIDPGDI